jgi:hypothetical protein
MALQPWKPRGVQMRGAWLNGTYVYSAFAENCDYPIGTVWARLTSNSYKQVVCEIVDVYVPKCFRRLGIGRFMLTQLLDDYGILKTGTGSKEGGMKLMLAMGWKRNRQTGDWYLKGEIKKMRKGK